MKRTQLASEALAHWTIITLREGERSLARQELPDLDLSTFFRTFANAENVPENISIALVGFDTDSAALKALAKKAGANCFKNFAADLHVAADWRNHRAQHPVIIAYARGTVTGVNTLRHFSQATSHDLTRTLLQWATGQQQFNGTPAHLKLLNELQALRKDDDDDVFSFEQIRAFLEVWSGGAGIGAPRDALPALGLLPDPNFFADATLIRQRLEQNIQLMETLRDRSTGNMEAIRKRLLRLESKASQKSELRARLKIFDKLLVIRRNPNLTNLGSVTLDEAFKVFGPPPKPEDKPKDEEENEEETRPLNEKKLQRVCADALLEDRDEELLENAEALSQGLRAALEDSDEDGDEEQWNCEVEVNGAKQSFKGSLDLKFVSWIRHFCQADAWGGLIETSVPDLRRALEDYDRPETLVVNPESLLQTKGQTLGLTKLLAGWDEDLAAQGRKNLNLAGLWKKLTELRGELLGSLEELTHFPLEWFAGKPEVTDVAKKYLDVSGKLFGLVAANYGAMSQIDTMWAKTTLEGLLALDVVQVRVKQPDNKISSKAVLLPAHPLHLWRYWRLSRILRGLGKDLNETDKSAVLLEAGEPVQFLSVIYASPLPGGRGAAQTLPVANDLYRLATFENLRNAYNGPDGQNTFVYAVERFAAAHRQHVTPLRVLLVNPPQAGTLLLELLKLLDGRKRDLVPRLRVEVRGTPLQAARLRASLLFDTREREIIEEKVASGRLELIVDRTPKPLDEILGELKTRPVHVVAVFDEAPVTVRRGGAGERLPMSPFCVRRKVAFHKRWNELRLEPTAGDPPFLEFIELIKHVEGNEGEGTPYAWPEAEALRKSVDGVLTPDEFGAHWFFLADRALPEEGEMRSQRLLRRREGQRQVLLASRSYESLARLMLPVFETDTPNLLMPIAKLQELLGEGAHLIGAGLLDVVKSQGGHVVPNAVISLMGALLAARNYLRRHPGALLVSTDSQLARTWLRLGTQGERCDLLGLREQNGKLILECIEVKTTRSKPRTTVDPEIERACEQITATLLAVREGLEDPALAENEGRHLAPPRNEMLKEVLVQGCMGRFASLEERTRWANWLQELFGAESEIPEIRGIVIDVALGSAEEVKPQEKVRDGMVVRVEHLNEMDVQRLLDPPSGDDTPNASNSGTPKPPSSPSKPGRKPESVAETRLKAKSKSAEDRIANKNTDPSSKRADCRVLLGHASDGSELHWEPTIRGNPHLMIVGLPGMGKTTCLVSLCRQLLASGVAPIVFSYHDDIDEKLGSHFPNLQLADCRHLGFNPMRVTEISHHAHLESAGQLRDIFAAIFPDLGDLQKEALRTALKESYEAKGWGKTEANQPLKIPAFRDFFARLKRDTHRDAGTKAVIARLDELDDYGFFGSAEETSSLFDLNQPIVLQIHRTQNEAVQRAYAAFAFYRLYQDMFARGRQENLTHAIIFDEAHKASGLKLIPTMAKECRKFGLALVVASQESRDFDPALFTAIANYLVLRVTYDTAKHLAKNVVASDRQRSVGDKLKALPKFEALWLTESRSVPKTIKLLGL